MASPSLNHLWFWAHGAPIWTYRARKAEDTEGTWESIFRPKPWLHAVLSGEWRMGYTHTSSDTVSSQRQVPKTGCSKSQEWEGTLQSCQKYRHPDQCPSEEIWRDSSLISWSAQWIEICMRGTSPCHLVAGSPRTSSCSQEVAATHIGDDQLRPAAFLS